MAIFIAAVPKTKMEPRGRLWVLVRTACVASILLRADDITVNRPGDCRRGPIDHIRMKFGGGRVDSRLGPSIVVTRDALAKVVGLHLPRVGVEVASAPLPVDLVVVVRHEHCTSNKALAWRGL